MEHAQLFIAGRWRNGSKGETAGELAPSAENIEWMAKEGGVEGLEAYLVTKTVTQRVLGADLEPV